MHPLNQQVQETKSILGEGEVNYKKLSVEMRLRAMQMRLRAMQMRSPIQPFYISVQNAER